MEAKGYAQAWRYAGGMQVAMEVEGVCTSTVVEAIPKWHVRRQWRYANGSRKGIHDGRGGI